MLQGASRGYSRNEILFIYKFSINYKFLISVFRMSISSILAREFVPLLIIILDNADISNETLILIGFVSDEQY